MKLENIPQLILILLFPPMLITYVYMWLKTKTWPFQSPDSELMKRAFGGRSR